MNESDQINSSFSVFVKRVETDVSFAEECILGIPTLVLNKSKSKDYLTYLNNVRKKGYFIIHEAKSTTSFKKWGFVRDEYTIDNTLNLIAIPNIEREKFQDIFMLPSAEEQLIEILLYLKYFPILQDRTSFWDKYINMFSDKYGVHGSYFIGDDGYWYIGSRYGKHFSIQK